MSDANLTRQIDPDRVVDLPPGFYRSGTICTSIFCIGLWIGLWDAFLLHLHLNVTPVNVGPQLKAQMYITLSPLLASWILIFIAAESLPSSAQSGDAKEADRLKRMLRDALAKPLDSRSDGPIMDGLACALARHDMSESGQALRRSLLCTARVEAEGGSGSALANIGKSFLNELPGK